MIAKKISSLEYKGYEIIGFDDGTFDIFEGKLHVLHELDSEEGAKAEIDVYGRLDNE